MRYLVKHLFLNPIIYLALGLSIGALGISSMTEAPRLTRASERVARLEPLTAQPSAREVFVEGRISEQNPLIWREFVSYLRERYRSSTARTSRWVEVARHTPPLVIDTPIGLIRIVNSDYRLESTAVTAQESEPTFLRGAVQSRGFTIGNPVFVVGTVAGERHLAARSICTGTREAYLALLET